MKENSYVTFFLSVFSFATIYESQDCRSSAVITQLMSTWDISRAITAEDSPLGIDSSQTQTGFQVQGNFMCNTINICNFSIFICSILLFVLETYTFIHSWNKRAFIFGFFFQFVRFLMKAKTNLNLQMKL